MLLGCDAPVMAVGVRCSLQKVIQQSARETGIVLGLSSHGGMSGTCTGSDMDIHHVDITSRPSTPQAIWSDSIGA